MLPPGTLLWSAHNADGAQGLASLHCPALEASEEVIPALLRLRYLLTYPREFDIVRLAVGDHGNGMLSQGLKRREFITGLGGAAVAWPAAARGQQPAMPVIGYLNGASSAQFAHLLAAFQKGLSEIGYAEGRNVAVEYRYADGHYDRLSALATDLVNQRVAVIVATAGTPTIRAAKAATSTIPIVFVIGGDPVMFGIVASLNRPGGNITGVTLGGAEFVAKRLELLLELVPMAHAIGVLANPKNPIAKPQLSELEPAAKSLAREFHVFNASTETELETAFEAVDQQRVNALVVTADPFFDDRRAQIIGLAARHRLPVSYTRRDFTTEGGLMSYGPDVPEAFHQAGIYTGRI